MASGFTFEDDDKNGSVPNASAFSWDADKSAPPKQAQTTTPSASAKQPEGMWHSAATAIGINPEQVAGAMQHPWESLKSAGSEAMDELRHPGTIVSQAGHSAPSLLNPEAQQTAISRLKSPGWKNKILGGEEYLESGIPGIGANLVKSHEQAAGGNYAGMTGTIAGTVLPALIDPGVRANIGEMTADIPTAAKTAATAPVRLAARATERAVNEIPGVSSVRAVKGLMQPADEAAGLKIKIPGRDFGLPAPAEPKSSIPQGPKLPAELAGPGGIPVMSDKPLALASPDVQPEQAIQQKMEFPTASEIAFRTDANGTRWARLPDSPAEVSIPKNLSGGDAQKYAQDKLELQSNFAKSRSPMGQLDELMKQQGGAPEGGIPASQPNVPLREQRQLQKPFGNRAAVDVSEMHGPRTTAPEQIPQAIPNAVDQAMGGDLTPEAIEKARLQEKYPDAGDRQAIHRTSEKTFEATRDNPELRKALGDLKAHDNQGGPDLARAAANLGEDLGERRIGNKKAEWMGAGQIGRGEMFDRLLDKGYTPQQILDAAQAEPASIPTLAKPGPMRTSGRKQVREKTGD